MSHEIEHEWTTRAGYPAMVMVILWQGRRSHRCGYVGVPPGHPLYGIEYNEPIDGVEDNRPELLFDVHGGLTYSGHRVPNSNLWWFGFDAAHFGDAYIDFTDGFLPGEVRSLDYMREECERLAEQLRDYAEKHR